MKKNTEIWHLNRKLNLKTMIMFDKTNIKIVGFMELEKRKIELDKKDNEIIYSKSIKAGKRIYYLDVKKSRNDDLFLAITESKKKIVGQDDDIQVSYEKHKIFLYKEDFDKFAEGLEEVIKFIKQEQGEAPQRQERVYDTPEPESTEDETKPKSFFDRFKL